MTKTIRAHQVQDMAEKLFGAKLREMENALKDLTTRFRVLEGKVGAVPIDNAEVIEEGSVLNKSKETTKGK